LEAAGHWLARVVPGGWGLYAGVVFLVVAITSLLNLDTSVAFLSPVLVHTARRRGQSEAPLLTACILLSNAGSLLLPGSNLTNLIVLGHLHLSGGRFAARMGSPFGAAAVVTAIVVAVLHRRELRPRVPVPDAPVRPNLGVGLTAVIASGVLVVLLRSPALPVAAVGLAAVSLRIVARRIDLRRAWEVPGVPVLLGLLGVAVALGTAGRDWTWPASLMSHLDPWATAAVAAVATVLVNNLPAASLLAAKVPAHPFALLLGLNIGPNLFVTGSLSWILWMRSAREAGGQPSASRAIRVGLIAAPLSLLAATSALLLGAGHG
ncbi:MAG TPA: SLC13 family permease, partial [Acidimicrobiales bacterium]|nr:SLC13 family permease [Acidimicrobiales bacterium]